MKGVILAAGNGTRLYPLTIDMPKPLLEVDGKPTIQYSIDKLLDAGINDIYIVIQGQYEDLFRMALKHNVDANIVYIHQENQHGIAHAIYLSEPFVNHEPFIVMLGDNITMTSIMPIVKLLNHEDTVITMSKTDEPQNYGIVEVDDYGQVIGLEEKPEEPKSRNAVMGVYGFHYSIFEAIEKTQLSEKGELEITDAIQVLLKQRKQVKSYYLPCLDMGTFERLGFADDIVKQLKQDH